jgi:hypothetical protein
MFGLAALLNDVSGVSVQTDGSLLLLSGPGLASPSLGGGTYVVQ